MVICQTSKGLNQKKAVDFFVCFSYVRLLIFGIWKNGMEPRFLLFDQIDITIGLEEVLRQLGYPCADSASDQFRKRAETELTEALQLIKPKGAYLLVEDAPATGLALFAEAENLVLGLATAGAAIGAKAGKLVNNSQGARGLIVDAVGTLAVEKAADFLERRIREEFTGQGWHVSRRYSPGYCDWDIRSQKELLGCFPDTFGIELTDSCLMIPEKSLTFLCVLGRENDFDWVDVGNCKICGRKGCSYRLHQYGTDSKVK